MIATYLQRMSQRERVLALIVGGAIFLLFNWIVWSWLMGTLNSAQAELTARKAARQQQSVFLKERRMWEKREDG